MFLNRPLVESSAHKCVIVLDRSPKFATPLATPITTQIKDEHSQTTFTGALCRTWWDTSVEAVLEYHRVIADLFPYGSKLVRLVVSDFVGRFLTPQWGEELITYERLLAELGGCDVPNAAGDGEACSILNGLSIGVEALSETTPLQKRSVEIMSDNGGELTSKPKAKSTEPTPSTSNAWANSREIGQKWLDYLKSSHRQGETVQDIDSTTQLDAVWRRLDLKNRGTIIVFTALDKPNQRFAEICEHVLEQVQARNESIKAVEHHDGQRSIDGVEVYVVNFSSNTTGPSWTTTTSGKSSLLRSTLIQLPPTKDSIETHLTANIHRLLHEVYDLASTTVSGIPMKEEAQSGQSINYDVELFHPRGAVADLESNNFLSDKYRILDTPPHGVYKTVRLKWCTVTAKMRSDKFPLLLGSFPLTPAFVSSRPSVCLTQFVLAGKAVMLEVSRELAAGGNSASKSIIPTRVEDIIASARDAVGPNLETQGKLISHFLVRDEVTGRLALQCVAMGKRATVPPTAALPSGIKPTPKDQLNMGALKQLFSVASLTAIPLNVAEQMAVMRGAADPIRSGDYRRETDLVAKFAAYLPKLTADSVVHQLGERFFGPLLTLFPKWSLNDADWEQCRQAIMALSAQKGANSELLAALKTVQLSGKTTMNDPFRHAMEELAKVLANFSHLSPRHEQLLRLLCETTGAPLPASTSVNSPQKGLKRAAQPSDAAPEAKKPMARMSLYDLCLRAYERKYEPVRRKKEFAGRQKWGDQAQGHLYPDLKLSAEDERPERGVRPPRRGGPRGRAAATNANGSE